MPTSPRTRLDERIRESNPVGDASPTVDDQVITPRGPARVLKRVAYRMRVEFADGRTGWVEAKDVESKDAANVPAALQRTAEDLLAHITAAGDPASRDGRAAGRCAGTARGKTSPDDLIPRM